MELSMQRTTRVLAIAAILFTGAVVGSDGSRSPAVNQTVIKELLEQLPYSGYASRDYERQQEIRKTLRAHAPVTLVVIVKEKALAPGDVAHRNLHQHLKEMFVGAREAIPALAPLLASPNWKERESAAMVLGWIGADEAAPALVGALKDEFWGVRMQAAFSLGKIDSLTPEAIEALVKNLGDEWYPANAAATALSQHPDDALTAVREALGSENGTVRYHAATAAGRMKGYADELLPRMISVVETDVPENQVHVLQAIDKWNVSLSAEYGAVLVRLLATPELRCDAARVLMKHGMPEQRRIALPVLLGEMTIRDTDPRSCRANAHKALHGVGPDAIPALIALLNSPFKETRRRAIIVLGNIEPQTDTSLRAIAGKLGDEDISGNARQELGKIGVRAVPVLTTAIRDGNPLAREAAALTLARIGPDANSAVPSLVAGLPAQTGATKKGFLFALGQIAGPDSRAAIPDLRAALDDPEFHDLAASALARIEKQDATGLSGRLVAMLAEQSRGMCPHPTAQNDLRAIGPTAAPAIVAALQDSGYGPKLQLLKILDEFDGEALESARPVFERWLSDGREFQRLHAAERLQRLDGDTSGEMLHVFRLQLNSGNPWYRLRGAEGIMRSGVLENDRAVSVLNELRAHKYDKVRGRAAAALEMSSGTSAVFP